MNEHVTSVSRALGLSLTVSELGFQVVFRVPRTNGMQQKYAFRGPVLFVSCVSAVVTVDGEQFCCVVFLCCIVHDVLFGATLRFALEENSLRHQIASVLSANC